VSRIVGVSLGVSLVDYLARDGFPPGRLIFIALSMKKVVV
jgi:hypothetical protein